MKKAPHSWSDAVDALKADSEEYLLSPGEIDGRILEICKLAGLDALGARVSIRDVHHLWGENATETVTQEIEHSDEIKLTLLCNADPAVLASVEHLSFRISLLESLVIAWGQPKRNKHGGFYLNQTEVRARFSKSIRRIAEISQTPELAFIYLDLDHFKEVNDGNNHSYGDAALRHVYACMNCMAKKYRGLAFFDGGDEFIVVLPSEDRLAILLSLWELRAGIQSRGFGATSSFKVGVTAGVVWRPVAQICDRHQEVKDLCETLIADIDGNKRRGTVTFEDWSEAPSTPHIASSYREYFQLGICLSRCHLALSQPFGDERLNFLALRSSETLGSGFSSPLDKASLGLDWLGLQQTEILDETPLLRNPAKGMELPRSALTLAVAHGLAVAQMKMESPAGGEPREEIEICWNDTPEVTAVRCGSAIVYGDSAASNRMTYGSLLKLDMDPISQGAMVGVQVGFTQAPKTSGGCDLPLDFFLAHVRVDSRPRSNGGLPDFWQVAVAQVVSTLGRSSQTSKVIFWGDSPSSTETHKRLSGGANWSREEVAALTGLTIAEVEDIGRGIPQKLSIAANFKALLDALYLSYTNSTEPSLAPQLLLTRDGEVPRLIRPMVSVSPIGQEEAVVCRTAAIAYPVIIDTLRKSEKVRHPKDDGDQELRELLGFKLKLTDPTRDRIPAYLSDHKADLTEYSESVLLNENGLIRSKLESGQQVSVFVSHLSGYLGNTETKRSTRRACLVVPNEVSEAGEPRPLGLMSVWATPRFASDGHRFVDFVFSWRTVEGFIGLPYSLFGSIELADQLVSLVNREISSNDSDPCRVGELTYFAMSLHLGDDHFHSRIAKRIVDSASD